MAEFERVSVPEGSVSVSCPACGRPGLGRRLEVAGRTRVLRCGDCTRTQALAAAQAEQERRSEQLARLRAARLRDIRALLIEAGVDDGHPLLGATLQNYNPVHNGRNLIQMKGLVERYLAGARPNAYNWGRVPGTGKSHLAVGALREVILERGVEEARFVRETRMTITLRSRCGASPGPESYLDALIRVPLLVLDDVGKAKIDTPWMRELMFEFVAGREGRSTILTSQWALDQLAGRDPWYEPLASRIKGKGPEMEFGGPDMRDPQQKRRSDA